MCECREGSCKMSNERWWRKWVRHHSCSILKEMTGNYGDKTGAQRRTLGRETGRYSSGKCQWLPSDWEKQLHMYTGCAHFWRKPVGCAGSLICTWVSAHEMTVRAIIISHFLPWPQMQLSLLMWSDGQEWPCEVSVTQERQTVTCVAPCRRFIIC